MPTSILEDAVCPACSNKGLEYHAEQIDLPYLGESLETMLRCNACGYRHNDFILTESSDPVRMSYRVDSEEAMSVRVVRSSSGTVRIPELGIDIEPGMASDAYITNVEGIIFRIEGILDQLHRDSDDAQHRLNIEKLLNQFQLMRDGKADPVTLVIEDPFGNSAIIHDTVVKVALSEEEASSLKTGVFLLGPDGEPLGE